MSDHISTVRLIMANKQAVRILPYCIAWFCEAGELLATCPVYLLTVSCFSNIQIGFTFLVPAHLGSPGQRAVKQVCVCLIYSLVHLFILDMTLQLIIYYFNAEKVVQHC